MIEQIDAAMAENRERYERAAEAVLANPDLSDSAKKREEGALFEKARARHEELYAKKAAEVSSRLDGARRAAIMAPPLVPGADKAMLMLSYRDALDRTHRIRDARELEEMLDRAQMTGDEVLARAVLVRGYGLESEPLVGRYLAAYPDHRSRWDRFSSAAEAFNAFERERKLFGAMGPRRLARAR
jgi:hypothetical protein